MKNSEKKPLAEHNAIKLIRRSVSALNMPPLAPLLGLFLNVKKGVEQERAELRKNMNELKLEAWGAAARLMSPQTKHGAMGQGYFERIEKQRGHKS